MLSLCRLVRHAGATYVILLNHSLCCVAVGQCVAGPVLLAGDVTDRRRRRYGNIAARQGAEDAQHWTHSDRSARAPCAGSTLRH